MSQPHHLTCDRYKTFSITFTRVIFPFVVQKSTSHVGTKALNMSHQEKKVFCGIFVGIPQHQFFYLVYVPRTSKIISSYDVVFDDIFSSTLAYTSQPYAKAMAMCMDVS